jgi:hypothetical protein
MIRQEYQREHCSRLHRGEERNGAICGSNEVAREEQIAPNEIRSGAPRLLLGSRNKNEVRAGKGKSRVRIVAPVALSDSAGRAIFFSPSSFPNCSTKLFFIYI